MGKVTEIAWTDHTFNPWIGCTRISAGCANCYAATLNHRWGKDNWGPGKERRVTSDSNWRQPLQWAKEAAKAGVRRRVFCASLADVFESEAPVEARRRLWELIDQTSYALDWQLVTKRPERIMGVMLDDGLPSWFFLSKRCWLLTTVEDQEQTKRVWDILAIPAAIRGVSVEPMLGPIDLNERELLCKTWRHGLTIGTYLDWVICGGESGSGARPMHQDWARSLRDQCKAAQVPFFFKQWGEWAPGECADNLPTKTERVASWFNNEWDYGTLTPRASEEVHRDDEPDVYRFGKRAAGRHLDGVEHNEFPEAADV